MRNNARTGGSSGECAESHVMSNDRTIVHDNHNVNRDSFLMNVQEMETARRLNLNLTVMVWADNAYGLIAWKQSNEFGRHTDLSFGNPDWLQLASAFDWHGHVVEKSEDLQNTLQQCFSEQGPSLLVIPIDYRENTLLTKRLGELTCSI